MNIAKMNNSNMGRLYAMWEGSPLPRGLPLNAPRPAQRTPARSQDKTSNLAAYRKRFSALKDETRMNDVMARTRARFAADRPLSLAGAQERFNALRRETRRNEARTSGPATLAEARQRVTAMKQRATLDGLCLHVERR